MGFAGGGEGGGAGGEGGVWERIGGSDKVLIRATPAPCPHPPFTFLLRLTPHASTSPLVPLHPPYYRHNVKGTPNEIEFANGKRE